MVDERDVKRLLTQEQLRRGACGVSYRAEQLAASALLDRLPGGLTARQLSAISNARIESALVNGRALAYFLGSPKKSGSDLNIHHYSLSAWTKPKGFDVLTKDIAKAASAHLAHASTGQKGVTPHPGQWALHELAVILVGAFADFVGALAAKNPHGADLFVPSPKLTYENLMANDPLREPTPVSKHPLVGELTRSLQAYLGIRGDEDTQSRDPCDPSVILRESG